MTQASYSLRGRNPDLLTCIANLSNDEVFTPPEFANRMLDTLAEALSGRLTERYGKGFSVTKLKYFRLFDQAFPDRLSIRHPAGDKSSQAVILHSTDAESSREVIPSPAGNLAPTRFSPQLSWSHHRALMRESNRTEQRP